MKSIFVIFLVLFLDLIAFTIILPLFPSIIDFYAQQDELSTNKDGALQQIQETMGWMKTSLAMPDRKRYNNVLIGGTYYTFSFTRNHASKLVVLNCDQFLNESFLVKLCSIDLKLLVFIDPAILILL